MPIVKINKCINCNVKHEWLFESMTLRELRTIKKVTGMTQAEFSAAGDNDDPEALAALLYVLHLRDKIKVPFEDIDLDFADFDMELTEQEKKTVAEAEAAKKLERSPGPKKSKSGPSEKAA